MAVSTQIENLIIKTQVQSVRSIRMSLPKYFSYALIPVECTMLEQYTHTNVHIHPM